jgi:hypothetical protein
MPMKKPKQVVRTSFPVNHLAELVRASGGKTPAQAIADAQGYVHSMRGVGLEGIEGAIAALEMIMTQASDRKLSHCQMQDILSYTDRLVMLATTFGFGRLCSITQSLGDLTVGLCSLGAGPLEPIAVHVRAARLFAPGAAQLADDDAANIFLKLRKVLKRFLHNAPVPANETYRQSVLKRLNILDTPPEEQFDRLTKLAAQHFKASIALISLVDKDRQWFMSRCGLDVAQTDRDIAFCAHAIMQDEPLIVLDATKDPRFAANPIVTGEPFIRFYAGAPLVTTEGVKLGTFCVIDQRPRSNFSEDERKALQNFAMRAMDMIYARVFHWLSTQEPKHRIQSAREANALSTAATRAFLDTSSSEIREPLSAIISLSKLMASEECRPNSLDQYRVYAQAIAAAADLTMRTLESTLGGRQAQCGELTLESEPIDLAEMIPNCLLPYQIQAQAMNVEFGTPQIQSELPLLSADRSQTEQMVVHLLASALSVASRGGQVAVAAQTSPGKGIEIRVCAVPAEVAKLPAISRHILDGTQPHKDAEQTGAKSARLAVAKQLIEMHGGSLDSLPGAKGEITTILTFPPFRALPAQAVNLAR